MHFPYKFYYSNLPNDIFILVILICTDRGSDTFGCKIEMDMVNLSCYITSSLSFFKNLCANAIELVNNQVNYTFIITLTICFFNKFVLQIKSYASMLHA